MPVWILESGIWDLLLLPMQHFLALDIGERRTGIAYSDEEYAVPLPLETFKHSSINELAKMVEELINERSITTLVVGLPLLPSGEEGEQAYSVRSTLAEFRIPSTVTVELLDERYTTPRDVHTDPDASAACTLLLTYLHRLSADTKGKEGS